MGGMRANVPGIQIRYQIPYLPARDHWRARHAEVRRRINQIDRFITQINEETQARAAFISAPKISENSQPSFINRPSSGLSGLFSMAQRIGSIFFGLFVR